MSRRLIGGIAAAIVPLGLLSVAAPAGAAPQYDDPCGFTGTRQVATCFSDPATDDPRLFHSVGALVDTADAGDSIRIIMYHWRSGTEPERLATAVVAARDRGADVRVIVDEASRADSNGQPYRSLQILQVGGVPVTVCGDEGSAADGEDDCLMNEGWHNPGSLLPMNHVKLLLFTIDGIPSIVAGSSNLTSWDHQTAWNDLTRIRGDRQLTDWLYDYFDRVWADDWLGWSTAADRDRSGDPVTDPADLPERAWVYPRPGGGDNIAGQLSHVTGCPSGSRVWVAMSKWNTGTRTRVLDQLDRIQGLGCDVKVLVSDDVADEQMSNLRQRLGTGNVRLLAKVHHKFIAVDARHDGVRHQYAVTGSHILAEGSLVANCEINVRVGGGAETDDGAAGQYLNRFGTLWAAAG